MANLTADISGILGALGAELDLVGEQAFESVHTTYRDLEFSGPVQYDLTVKNVGEGVMAQGKVVARFTFPCSRCLNRFTFVVEGRIDELFRPDPKAKHSINDGVIELTPVAEQAIFINLPVKTLCRDDCRGLCPVCGCDLNKSQCECRPEAAPSPFAKLKDLFDAD